MEFTKRFFSKDRVTSETKMSLIDRIKEKFKFKSQERRLPIVDNNQATTQMPEIRPNKE
jgi:hypothetical protein